MATVSPYSTITPTTAQNHKSGMGDLGSQDFLKLLLTELTNQDPLEPTDNEALLRQISSIRDIEMSTTLTESIQRLAGQQQIGSASTLIGQFVTGIPGEDGTVVSGMVMGVRFADGGRPILQLSTGAEMPLEQVASVQPPQQAAEFMVGAAVIGLDRRKADEPELVEGVVTGVSQTSSGEVTLELDNGENLRLRDVLSVITGQLEEE